MKKMITLILAVLLICCSAGCTANVNEDFPTISKNKVESISVWTQHTANSRELDAAEMETVIKLYNQSQYMGEANGNGGTPEWGVCVSFKNGDVLYMNEFNGREDFEVSWYTAAGTKAWYYINNQEMMVFITKIIETMD